MTRVLTPLVFSDVIAPSLQEIAEREYNRPSPFYARLLGLSEGRLPRRTYREELEERERDHLKLRKRLHDFYKKHPEEGLP